MALQFGILNELDVGSLTVGGNLIAAVGNRLQAGNIGNSTLMLSDSGAFATLTTFNTASGVLAGQTAASGSSLYSMIIGLSGFDLSDFATLVNLQLTGQQLGASIGVLSGFNNVLTQATGQALYNDLINASGALSLGVSGSANVVNSDLFGIGNIAVILSGASAVYISGGTGLALTTNLAATGTALLNDIIRLSGQLTVPPISMQTGITFNFALPYLDYIWSGNGVSISGTGILPNAQTSSGLIFTIKHQNLVQSAAVLIVSGLPTGPDGSAGFAIYPFSAFSLWSDGRAWNAL